MLFNSIEFALFLPVVFLAYWFIFPKNLKVQNLFLLGVSYFFYGWWDWRFLFLIAFSSLVDFGVGVSLKRTESPKTRKWLLGMSLLVNLGFLGFFKYYNFFAENFVSAFTLFGQQMDVARLNIILPVGISFYTFQTLSYSIDAYRRKITPIEDPIAFFAFVSFFPQLVAGPIERASNLLPQFLRERTFSYENAVNGLRQILWGLCKKVIIADYCAYYANLIFTQHNEFSGSTLLLGAIFFSFQIYGDFSGYSDIAIGTARLFGFNLMRNFAHPYFSRDIAEFWRRWHISLSTWFRDYVYIPLGGSKHGIKVSIRNIFIIFLVSGFWHGANWTFIAWGAINALYFLPLFLAGKNRQHTGPIAPNRGFPSGKEFFHISLTFSLTTLAWIFFRAETIGHAFAYYNGLFSSTLFNFPEVLPKLLLLTLSLFMLIEWMGRDNQFAIERIFLKRPRSIRWSFYLLLSFLIYINIDSEEPFIYFQF